ncbi:MAG: hypothetical protein HC921_22210 [Synechococcaceae cyanobacterium SM2_3_1]|nr:hypothetical protein [Synechococcaceae cyanobacterium SM2_3_1]
MTAILFQVICSEKDINHDIYTVKSVTFHPEREIELGKVIINKKIAEYEFIPSEEWKSSGFSLPHTFYKFEKDKDLESLPENDRPEGWPWGLLIHKRILSLIRREYLDDNN